MSTTDPISNEILPSASSEGTPLLQDHTNSGPTYSHGHSHGGSMNMRALVLHVLGDALGNVGVIATGLVIWKTSWSFKYYFDPIISLVITLIIFSSALPLGEFWEYTKHVIYLSLTSIIQCEVLHLSSYKGCHQQYPLTRLKHPSWQYLA